MPIEWWYFNGHLVDDKGAEYSFHFVTFQRITANGLTPQVLHASFSDHTKRTYQGSEKLALAHTRTSPGSFSFQAEGWRMSGDGLDYVLAFGVSDYFLLLRAASRKPAVLHQQTGVVDLGPGGQSYYYSRTRIEATGSLSLGREDRAVRGTIWMDHQWGDFNTAPVGWDWVALQLDDGSELMVSMVWDAATRSPVASYGTYIAADGLVQHLGGQEVALKATGFWSSPTSETTYPVGWTVGVMPLSLVATLTPVLPDSEFAISTYIPVPYWEGAVRVRGTKYGVPVTGKGFVELAGYAPRNASAGFGTPGVRQGR